MSVRYALRMKNIVRIIATHLQAAIAHWLGYVVAVLPAVLVLSLYAVPPSEHLAVLGKQGGAQLARPDFAIILAGIALLTSAIAGVIAAVAYLRDLLDSEYRLRSKRRHVIGMAATNVVVVGLPGALATYGAMLVFIPVLAASGALGGLVRWTISPFGQRTPQ